jgi:hypothetical protein
MNTKIMYFTTSLPNQKLMIVVANAYYRLSPIEVEAKIAVIIADMRRDRLLVASNRMSTDHASYMLPDGEQRSAWQRDEIVFRYDVEVAA